MTDYFPLHDWSDVEPLLDVIGHPAFLIKVGGARTFTFHAMNLAHQNQVGLDQTHFVGQSPEAVLPPRLAETLVENYEQCRLSAKAFTYEEQLQFPKGTCWWHTSLSPIFDTSGAVTMILGIALDIADVKAAEFRAAEKLSETVLQNRTHFGKMSRTICDVRGPFQSVLGIISVLRDGFIDLGDDKLDLCDDIARTALAQIDELCHSSDHLIGGAEMLRKVDMGHLCRNIVAIIDPDRRFDITFPTCGIMVDQTALELILRQILESTSKYANDTIVIDVFQNDGGFLGFHILDDGAGAAPGLRCDGTAILPEKTTRRDLSRIGRAHRLIGGCGGALELCRDKAGRVGIAFQLRGTILKDAAANQDRNAA